MGRANNVARSLIIISKGQGWDPCQIDGEQYTHGIYKENRPTHGDESFVGNEYVEAQPVKGDSYWPPMPPSPQSHHPDASMGGPDTRGNAIGKDHGRHDPEAGK